MNTARRALLTAAACMLAAVVSCAQQAGSARPLSDEERRELGRFTGQLADPRRIATTKREAAAHLLTRPYPQAAEALRDFLVDAANRPARIAVAEAVAERGGSNKLFVQPLLAMLHSKDAAVRAAGARALATYQAHGVIGRLIGIARDRDAERAVRLTTIGVLQHVLDKAAVDALVGLLDERDAAIRAAAADALTRLTYIQAFGADAAQWKRWWARNKDKPRAVWLADLTNSLARAKAALEAENAKLRDRLARALSDLYAAAPAARQEAMLLGFLKDTLLDVRRAGATLTARRIAAGGLIGEPIRLQVRAMLDDGDARVRTEAALLVADLDDREALEGLLDRLAVEQDPAVRRAILTALGRLGDPKTLPAVLTEIRSADPALAAAATGALARMAAKSPLAEATRAQAVKALTDRYAAAGADGNEAKLREALMTAMGVLADKAFVPALTGGLKDPVAAVRLAAVKGLTSLRNGSQDIIAPLVADSDRGVRQAALTALGALDGARHLDTILAHADPAAEADAGVRQQAWDIALGVLAKADAARLARVATALAGREDPDAADQRIKVLQMRVDVLAEAKGPQLPAARRALGLALVAAARPAEATPHLAEAYTRYTASGGAEATAVWGEWIDALLAAEDPAVAKALADQKDPALFDAGLRRLIAHLEKLNRAKRYTAVAALAAAALKQLPDRLDKDRTRALEKTLRAARAARLEADRQAVAKLTRQLLGGEEAARKATLQLQTMGDRAVRPTVEQLRGALQADKPDQALEAALLAVLTRLAPQLERYDDDATTAQKLKVVQGWLAGF